MAETTIVTKPHSTDITWRQIENMRPGQWWEGEYYVDEDSDETHMLWAEVSMVMSGTQITTGRKVVRVLGTATNGAGVEMGHYRGEQIKTVTARQAKKAGLVVPERTEHGDG